MLNTEEINNTIEELENSVTTFDTCLKLSSLYICRDNIEKSLKQTGNNKSNEVIEEYRDILPQYHRYIEIKTKYQLGEISPVAIENSIGGVCKEIQEFIHTMYRCTDMQLERDCIKSMIENLQTML